jgi:hypothetical protein
MNIAISESIYANNIGFSSSALNKRKRNEGDNTTQHTTRQRGKVR